MSATAHVPSPEFVRAMEPVARELLGEPSEINRGKRELRWGNRGSMCVSLDKGTWKNRETDEGGGVLDLVQHKTGLDKTGAVAWLKERGHLSSDVPARPATRRQVAAYRYVDAAGVLLFEVVRFEPKDFRQRRPDGNGGWVWKLDGVALTLYRLPELLAAVKAGHTVFVTEGEKAADALVGLGLAATCSPAGAGKWRAAYAAHLAGADVVILPDNDEPGRKHAATVEAGLRGKASRVRVLDLPGLPPKGDVVDWIAAGGTPAALAALTDEAPEPAAADPAPAAPLSSRATLGRDESGTPTSLNGQDLTEDGLALAFAEAHQDTLRYDHTRGAWFHWTGKAWRQDEIKLAFSWSRRICRQLAKEGSAQDKLLATLAKASTAAAVERFAQSDPTLAVTSSIWDRDPFLLGTPGGTIDLRTGDLRAPVPEDHITKLTAVAPVLVPECKLWLAFLHQATNGDAELIRFLQQWAGYCLTGDTREHALMFVHGPGGNGKGVFLNTLAGILGEYARNAAMDTFTASSSDRHPTDLAMLRGARLVTASETEEGRAWAESRIKALTGGDTITARFMRQDFFEYVPQFKLTIIGNHRPVLRNVDDAARRRFNVVPFTNKPEKADRQLETKLRREWPEILRWMIEGCLDWQQHGLVRPAIVLATTAEYFSEQDTVHQWVEEKCDLGTRQFDTLAVLFKSWSDYAMANGEKPGTAKWFSQTLGRLNCNPVKNTPGNHGKRGFVGIAVKPVEVKGHHQDQAESR